MALDAARAWLEITLDTDDAGIVVSVNIDADVADIVLELMVLVTWLELVLNVKDMIADVDSATGDKLTGLVSAAATTLSDP